MKIASKTALVAALFAAGTALSQAAEEPRQVPAQIKATDEGVLFANHLGADIAEAYAQPKEKCDVYLCNEWRRIDRGGATTLTAGKAAAMGLIFSPKAGGPRVCQWDIKVVTVEPMTYEFGPFDVCVPDLRNKISFKKDGDQVTATQSWKDDKGDVQTATVDAR